MDQEKFLADENVDNRIVIALRELGYDIHAIIEMDRGISDDEVLELSNEFNAIILTEDKDFGELTYRLQKKSNGIILIRISGVDIEQKIDIIRQVLTSHLSELRNSFTVITQNKIRIKEL